MQQVNDSFGNWSQYLASYPNIDTDSNDDLDTAKLDNGSIVRSHNTTWVTDKLINNCSVDTSCDAITYDNELDYYTDSDIGGDETAFDGWDKDSSNDLDLASVVSLDLVNGSYVNDSITAHNASIKSYIDAQDHSANCSVDQSCDTIIYTTDKLGNTTAEIRAQFGNSSNITYDESTGTFYYNGSVGTGTSFDPSTIDYVNHTQLGNDTIVRSHNTSWIGVTVDATFVDNLFTDDLTSDDSNSTSDIWSAISNQTWDTRIDTIENFTIQEINDSFGNWSQYLASYPNIDTDSSNDLVDSDFGSSGLMKTDGAGTYSIITDNSVTWNTALTNGTDAKFGLLNITTNLRISNATQGTSALIWHNGSGICIGAC